MIIQKMSLTVTMSITEIPTNIGTAPLMKKITRTMTIGLTMNLQGGNFGLINELRYDCGN